MRRSILSRLVALGVVTAGLAGCDNTTNDTGVSPITPTPVNITETFTGSLTPNGAVTHPFTVLTGGTVTAVLKEVTPDATIAVGVALGTWNGTNCQIVLPNDDALQGAVVIGSVTSIGQLCVRVYDAQGKLTETSGYTIDVNHP